MHRRTWQECTLWVNIAVFHPAIRRVRTMQRDELNIAYLTRRMCLFENSIPFWVLLWESFIHTHTILNSVCLFLLDSFLSRVQQLFSLRDPIAAISGVWLVTPYLEPNKRRKAISLLLSYKTTRIATSLVICSDPSQPVHPSKEQLGIGFWIL